jgi:uncharacterized protein YecT (DUF1311 family)
MPSFRAVRRLVHAFTTLSFAALAFLVTASLSPNAAAQAAAGPDARPLSSYDKSYDKSIFQKPIPAGQLTFLNHFSGAASGDLIRDKQYHKLMHEIIPDVMFHYGWDIMLSDALEKVLASSTIPVQIRDNRYFLVSGRSGPYLAGRGLMWIDMQDGIALGGFYFHPTNGEPTPTVTVFSRQLRVPAIKLSQLPPAFADDLRQWSTDSGVPAVTTRYFIGDNKLRLLLEHDEDSCASLRGTPASTDQCEQMNADAADIDLNAAYYLDQINYATNGTAWMINTPDQTNWLQMRDDTCRLRPDRLGCTIRMTRDRIRVVIERHPAPQQPPRHR